jgi:hypothetical protein
VTKNPVCIPRRNKQNPGKKKSETRGGVAVSLYTKKKNQQSEFLHMSGKPFTDMLEEAGEVWGSRRR